jgi:hypothetical protein
LAENTVLAAGFNCLLLLLGAAGDAALALDLGLSTDVASGSKKLPMLPLRTVGVFGVAGKIG